MKSRFYVLEGHEPRPVTPEEWGRWMETGRRQVDFSDLGYCTVSTVFLGVDHRFGEGPPILFETMVFGPPEGTTSFPEEWDGRMNRYATWDEAAAGHAEMVAELRAAFWRRGNEK
jgi:hypothetical protein